MVFSNLILVKHFFTLETEISCRFQIQESKNHYNPYIIHIYRIMYNIVYSIVQYVLVYCLYN